MEFMTEADFRKELKSAPAPGYLFFGEEDYLKAYDLSLARKTLCPDEALSAFNLMEFDALTYSPGALEDALLVPPMMTDRKLVIVRGLDLSSMRQDEVEALAGACGASKETGDTVLILSVPAGGLDPGYLPKRPSAVLGRLGEVLKPVWFTRSTPRQLAAWAMRHYAAHGVRADEAIAEATVSRCGTDMFHLSSEIEKISYHALAHGRESVTREDVEEAGIASVEFDGFAFSDAIMGGRRAEALAILDDMRARRVEPIPALGEILRVWCDLVAVQALMAEGKSQQEIAAILKMHTFRVGIYCREVAGIPREKLLRVLDACVEADQSVKLGQGYRALELLICSM